ncbi:MAG TPA: hypothetical protein VLD86_06850 [Ilumatobacteraceae bacterium]|nr:hypothetical protein [Ilumatobacteraceae bacterium]
MVDQARRDQLRAVKLAALIGAQWPDANPTSAAFALGAAAVHDDVGWVLLEERYQSGLGPALAWTLRAGIGRLHVLAEEGTGTIARRARAFAFPIEVWQVAGRALLPALAEPLTAAAALPVDHARFVPLIRDGGATPVVEHGVLTGDVRGLEVCRVVTDAYTGVTRLEVGIGQHDREAFRMLHGDVPSADALAAVVAKVAPHRQHGADPHPLNRLGQERALRARLIEEPGLVGAERVEAAPSPIARSSLKDPQPCVAVAESGGRVETLVVSSGVDLDLVPFATDARLQSGLSTRIVVPRRDVVPVQEELAALLHEPMAIVPID